MARVGRDRIRHKRMPKGWRPARSGHIYFRPTNLEDRAIVRAITGGPLSLLLGRTHDEAATTYATLIVAAREKSRQAEEYKPGTVAELCYLARQDEGFLASIASTETRSERKRHIAELEALFGDRKYARNVFDASRDTNGVYLRAMDVQRHVFLFKGKRGRVSVNRRVRTWELLFQWGRAPWGLTEYNPCSGIIPNEEKPRKVVPTDPSIFKLYRELSPPARFMVGMIRYYGRRKVEQLALDVDSGREDGIHFRRGKDNEGKPIIVKWDPRNKRMWARALRWREKVIRPTKVWKNGKRKPRPRVIDATALLLNSRGRRMTASGFNSERKRAMEAAGIKGEFTFHDLRKSRAQDGLTLAEAQNVLAHDDQRTTSVTYRPTAPVVVDMNAEVAAKRRKG